jgi:diguanylate cyclase (GGDEF)-like protein
MSMLRERRDRLDERIAAARVLAAEARIDELRSLLAELEADPDTPPGPDDRLLLGILDATASTNAGDLPTARAKLDALLPQVVAASPLMQARHHVCSAYVASEEGRGEAAVDDVVVALAALESVNEVGEDLAAVLYNAAFALAHCQLFPLAVETAERALDVARAVGLPTAWYQHGVGYAYLAWAMRLEHLGLEADSAERWTAATERFAASLVEQASGLRRALGAVFRAVAEARLGHPEEGRRCLAESAATAVGTVTPDLRRLRWQAECDLLLAEGRLGEARTQLAAYWDEAGRLHNPPWTEDAAFLCARAAELDGDLPTAMRWYREVHERYGRAQYAVWLSRATAARLRVEQEALLRRAEQLEEDALSDPLTGVPNRRAFDTALPRLVGDAQSAASPLTLAILDVDRFKRVNDTYGHLVGDEVLRRIAGVLRRHTRETDRSARYGGDEFVLCLPVPEPDARATVARIVRAVAEHPWAQVAEGLAVSITAGTAGLGPGDTSTSLFWAADQALLAAKAARAPEQLRHLRSV